MSNYLLAFGKTEKINQLHSWFDQPDEMTVVELDSGLSLMLVNKGETIHRVGNAQVFFTGWIQDHQSESFVFGGEGYANWISSKEICNSEYEGAYVSCIHEDGALTVQNDLFSYFPVIYFVESDLFVCSDSLFILSELRKFLGLQCKLNKKVMHTRAWTHGLACSVMSNQTQIEDVYILSPGKHISLQYDQSGLTNSKNCVVSKPLMEIFSMNFSSYEEAIRDATIKFANSVTSMLQNEETMFKFGLSGGLDSRVILAAMLHKTELFNRVTINTNKHPSRKADFDVVKQLSELYNFQFNDPDKINQHKQKYPMKLERNEDSFTLWILSSMGLFDMMYLHDSYWPIPHIAEIGGHGAETIKGTFAATQFSDYIYKPTYLGSALRMFKDIRQIRFQHKRRAMIRKEMADGLQSSGIDLSSPGSIQWHHLCYKSPIQNGRNLDRTILAIRPFIQHSLFALAISDKNPFRYAKEGEPTLLHDMLILLHPELAGEAFDNSKTNISKEYIQSRLKELGGPLTLNDSQPYSLFGRIQNLRNGPPQAFVNKVHFKFEEDENVMARTLKTLESVWSSIEDDVIRKVYQSAYDTAKERLTDSDYYPPSAGTPAAKVISLLLLD